MLQALGNPLETRFGTLIQAETIVNIAGPVNTQSNSELIVGEELSPFLINQHSVDLDGVFDDHAESALFPLEFEFLDKKGKAGEHRLSTVPPTRHVVCGAVPRRIAG